MSTELMDVEEVLFRHIHPDYMNDGEPSSDRFIPTKRDLNKLSLDRSALTTAKAAHELFVSTGAKATAVFGLSIGEFNGESIKCFADPIPASAEKKGNPAHALADYSIHPEKNQKNIAKRLKRLAIARKQLHPPT